MLSSRLVKLVMLCALCAAAGFAQCTFQLTPASANFTNSSNDTVVSVSASASTCTWTATSNTAWITISFGQSGKGNGSVGFTVLQNNNFAPRSGSLTIAGINFPVTQAAAPCSYSLSPNNATVAAAGASGSFNVTTGSGCAWTASTAASWLSVTGSGSSTGMVQYSAAPNTTGASRTGTITVGTASFTVTQGVPCTFTLNPVLYQADPSGATSTFTVQASPSSCTWTATANDDFVTVTTGGSGTGNGTVGFKVAANTTQNPRGSSITVGNTAFTIYQPGGPPCSFVLSGGSASFTPSGGASSFTVTTTCAWTPVSQADWIVLSSSATITGNGVVGFVVTPNTSSVGRSAAITVGNLAFLITESGVSCNVTVAQLVLSAPAGGLQGILDVTAPDGCSWTAASGANWITLQAPGGSGQGAVGYTIAPNTTGSPRSANITIANQVIRVTQDGADCSGQVLTPSHAELPASAGTFSFNVGTACSYTAVANSGWIKIISGGSGTGSADVGYTVSANSSADARMGAITVGPQTFTISQSGTSCSLSINPSSDDVPGQGGAGSFNVTATASCRWQPVADAGWIHTTFASANGSGKVNYSADRSDQAQARAGRIFVNGQVFVLTQGPRAAIQVTKAGVVNAASLANGPVSPGEIVTIFGDGLGPDPGVAGQLTPDGQAFTSTLAGTTVLFDGNPAALIYVSKTQISAIVPYSVDGSPSTQMQIGYQGALSDAITLEVAAAAPGVFTIDASGAGQAAALNQDTKVNSATNPAAKNSVISLFATGEGQTNPPGVDGKLARVPLPHPLLPVTVQLGGREAVVTYAGAAQGLTAGVLQVNVRIPAQAPSGAVPVVITVGNVASQSKVTVAVQ